MLSVLESVPWFIIAAFAGSGILALAAGRPDPSGHAGDSRIAARVAGMSYAVTAAFIIGLWIREQF